MNNLSDHPKFVTLAVRIGGSLVHWLVAGALALAISIIVVTAYGYLHRSDPVAIPVVCP